MYDYLIVGAGLYGSTFAYEATKRGKKVLVIDKRNHVGGNIYCENIEGINVHKYGAHIFHTSDKEVWDYVIVEFNRYTNQPIANFNGEIYNLPFNMNTFNKLWGVITPEEAKLKIEEQKKQAGIEIPKNLEEQAISLVGTDIYEKLIKGYTEKQWGRSATELPAFIIRRLPVRFSYDNNYFNDLYQGIPIGGYNKIIEKMLEKCDVRLGVDFFEHKDELEKKAEKILFTGMIDEFYDYKFGVLEYRSLKFETEILNEENYQGNAVVNYTDREYGTQNKTVITKEYPADWKIGDEPYYPINNDRNDEMFAKYKELAVREDKYIFGGRLADYKYYDMHNVIRAALDKVKEAM